MTDPATAARDAFDPIDPDLLRGAGLARFEHLAIVDSTMERAREWAADASCPLPAAVVADVQTRGRGRRGARWWQAPGSLAVSVVVATPPESAARSAVGVGANASSGGMMPGANPPPAVWSLACGVALAEAIAAVEPAVDPLVRWPNDVEAEGRKLAGILVEALPGGRAVFGVGVNTTGSAREAPPEIARRVATLPDLAGRPLPRGRLLAEFLPRLFRLLAETAVDVAAFVPRYRSRCGLAGHPVTVHRGGARITGLCRGIDAGGGLVVDTPAGRVHVTSGSLTDPADVWRGE
jgi:BirA family biotin operon repressor/biotin-[acetyl-CoA-carboxylase] ligase